MNDKEKWVYLKKFNCKVSNFGNVFNNGIIRKKFIGKNGYWVVNLYIKGKSRNRISAYVHRLIGIAFIKNALNKKQINHKNGLKTDNSISNLEWVTPKENAIHAWKTGLSTQKENRAKGTKINTCKLTPTKVRNIKRLNKTGVKGATLSRKYGVTKEAIYLILNGRNWKWIK